MGDLYTKTSAVISPCGMYRYRLDRDFGESGPVFAYVGVNPSTAGENIDDQTTMKWRGFTLRNGGRKYIAVNPFAYRSAHVNDLASVADPVGPENERYIEQVLAEADVLVPCWGSRWKLPHVLHRHLDRLFLKIQLHRNVKVFGITASGDPKHPLMLGYNTPLVSLNRIS